MHNFVGFSGTGDVILMLGLNWWASRPILKVLVCEPESGSAFAAWDTPHPEARLLSVGEKYPRRVLSASPPPLLVWPLQCHLRVKTTLSERQMDCRWQNVEVSEFASPPPPLDDSVCRCCRPRCRSIGGFKMCPTTLLLHIFSRDFFLKITAILENHKLPPRWLRMGHVRV